MGATPHELAARYSNLSAGAIGAHLKRHLPVSLRKALRFKDGNSADALIARLRAVEERLERLALKAEHAGDFRAAVGAARELHRSIEMFGRLMGHFQPTSPSGANVNVNVAVIGPEEGERIARAYLARRKARKALPDVAQSDHSGAQVVDVAAVGDGGRVSNPPAEDEE
jgi:hypothetical protein